MDSDFFNAINGNDGDIIIAIELALQPRDLLMCVHVVLGL